MIVVPKYKQIFGSIFLEDDIINEDVIDILNRGSMKWRSFTDPTKWKASSIAQMCNKQYYIERDVGHLIPNISTSEYHRIEKETA